LPLVKALAGAVAALLFVSIPGCASRPSPASSAPPTAAKEPAPLFQFHVDFWANLNQVLLHEALLPRPGWEGPKSLRGQHVAPADAVPAAEAGDWKKALAYYDGHFTSQNLLDRFTPSMPVLLGIGPSQTPPVTPEVDAEWRQSLVAAAPVYRAHFWPDHEARDRAYVEAMRAPIAAHGSWFAKRIVAAYQTPLPAGPIDVEITPVVPLFGGFTQGEPPYTPSHEALITLSSEDPAYAGDTGVEMLFHEASHLLVGRVQDGLDASAKRQGRKLDPRFWHDLIFYTAGHLAQERLGPSYVPFAERPSSRLFKADDPSLAILKREWQPYLDGRTTIDAAIDAMAAAFPPG
jgi:hypothetical protein